MRLVHGEQEQPGFKPKSGVRQGCALSPLLFSLFFEYVIRVAMKTSKQFPEAIHWPSLGGALINLIGYADDLALLSTSHKHISKWTDKLERTFDSAGLELSDKSKVLSIATGKKETTLVPIKAGNHTLEQVNSFKYLGNLLTRDGGIDAESIEARNRLAAVAFERLRCIWNSPMKQPIKALAFRTLVRPIVLYGAENWTLSKKDEQELDVWDMRLIRQLVQEKDRIYITEDGQRRRKSNDSIRKAAEIQVRLSEMCRQARLRQWGHFRRLPPTSTIS